MTYSEWVKANGFELTAEMYAFGEATWLAARTESRLDLQIYNDDGSLNVPVGVDVPDITYDLL